MNVLLIYPECPDTFWSFKYALKFFHKKAGSPPLGLLTVAAMLPQEWQKRLVDLNVTKLTARDLAWADCAFVSGMAIQRDTAHRVIARCKEAGLKIVAGGPLFTFEHESFGDVDHFVLNEAELTLPPFLADLARGCAKRMYASSEFADLTQTPAPMWELADLKRYIWVGVQFSRGCPHQCDFCNVTSLLGRRPRTKTAAQITAELDSLYALGWRGHIFFVDDNFIAARRYLKEELMPALIRWQKKSVGIPFHTEVSIDLADDEPLMQMMAEAGFHDVFIGIETPDEESLKECAKRQNQNRQLVSDIRRIHAAGLQVQAGFILGFDHDTPSTFQRQIDFIQTSGIVVAMVGLLQALPGTKLYERLRSEGRLRGQLPTGDNVDGSTNIVPVMNAEALREGYRHVIQHIYTPRHFYRRVKRFLQQYKAPSVKPARRLSDVMIVLRSVLHLGIMGKERYHYWRLILWTYFRRPELLWLAVVMAIWGHHFQRSSRQHVV